MSKRSEELRAEARAVINILDQVRLDPVKIETLRRLLRQNTSLAETLSRLWQDNAALRERQKHLEQKMREEIKKARRAKLDAAEERFEEVRAAVLYHGACMDLVNAQPGQWLITSDGHTTVQYWPSARKWQITRTGEIKHGGVDKFIEFVLRNL